jgi:hypothetical protein
LLLFPHRSPRSVIRIPQFSGPSQQSTIHIPQFISPSFLLLDSYFLPQFRLLISAVPAISIVEDLQAALAQFAEIASDLEKSK